MRKFATIFLSHLASFLEFCISVILAIGIILLTIRLASSLGNVPNLDVYPNYEDLLESCFNLIIGVELIRMMYRHTPDTVFEVLLFAIARQIIVDHSSPTASLLGVLSIAVLFATRKFLFINFDISDKSLLRAASKVKVVNRILGVTIPYEGSQTLSDVLAAKAEEEKIELGIGTCVYFTDCGLRVAKMHDGKISRIEVIRTIH